MMICIALWWARTNEVKNPDLLEIVSIEKLEGEDEGLFRVMMKGHDEPQEIGQKTLDNLQSVIAANKQGKKKKLRPEQVAAIKVKEKMKSGENKKARKNA